MAESRPTSSATELEVFFLTLESFPNGTAQTNKLGLFARAVQCAGASVRILMLEAFEDPARLRNRDARGVFHGIPFEYTPGQTTRAASFLERNSLKWKGVATALQRLREARGKSRIAIFFMHDAGRLMPMLIACRLLGIRTVVDLCEWMPAMDHPSRANRWGYESGMVFKLCDAVIPISRMLEARVQEVTRKAPASFYLSNLIDPVEFESRASSPESRPYILWAGLMDQYLPTVRFVLSAFSLVRRTHPELHLVLCGGASAETQALVLQAARDMGIPAESVTLPGFVSRPDLLAYYAGALALLVPLEDDERSRARFPFKLGEYLLTGRPVVSTRIGDIPHYLEHGRSAMLATAEDRTSFAECIETLLDDPELAREIGNAGAAVAYSRFDYRVRGPEIASFLQSVLRNDR